MALCGLLHALATGADLFAPLTVLPLLALSLCGQVLYGTCLTATLKRGDLSVYYPIIRASPVFVVAVGVFLLGRSYGPMMLTGVVMVVLGGFILLYRRGTNMLEDPITLGLAILAMCGSGIYSIADEQTMQVIAPSVQMLWIEGALIPIFLGGYLYNLRDRPQSEWPQLTIRRITRIAIPGVVAYTSYIMILNAYRLGGEVAAVTSIRQASIPVSVLLGGYFLREGSIVRRMIASLVLACGIIIVAISG
jgi:drug/metabolite transporter (DMT)-like permease